MAREVIEKLIDDLDGGEATETVTFGLDGASYEIDLSKKNAAHSASPLRVTSARLGGARRRLAPLGARRRRQRTAPSRSVSSRFCSCASGQAPTRSPCPLGGGSRTRWSSSTSRPAAAESQASACRSPTEPRSGSRRSVFAPAGMTSSGYSDASTAGYGGRSVPART